MDSPADELKILIVDDDHNLLDTLSIVLSSCGYSVTSARSGAEGAKLLEAEKYDVVLVDLRMPRMDRHQFLRFVKLVDPDCRVVMMSAYATAEAVVEAIRENAYDFLLKPFKLEELQAVLNKASLEIRSSMRSGKE